jgi:alkaline phosphatase
MLPANSKMDINMKKITTIIGLLLIIFTIQLYSGTPGNIILMISDGCGFNHVKATDYYQYGKSGCQPYQNFSVKCAMSTYNINGEYDTHKAWHNFKNLIQKYTDSAASSTAMVTGIKTYNGALGVNKNKKNLKNIVEYAEDKGLSTGVISSVYFAHATPAGMIVHNSSRDRFQQISRAMILDSRVDVIMGCGHPLYDNNGRKIDSENNSIPIDYQFVGGEKVWNFLVNNKIGNDCDGDGNIEKWNLLQKREDFVNLFKGATPERVIGIPQVRETLQYRRSGNETRPFQIAFNQNVPTLEEMTKAGLNIIDNNDKGFFLMIEGGAVDWASHDSKSCRMIEEQIDFNNSVQTVINWVENHSSWEETLVIVTADHECGYLNGPESGGEREESEPLDSVWKPIVNRGQGQLPGMKWYYHSHSNSLVPFYAEGAGSEKLLEKADQKDLRYGKYLDNAELGQVLIEFVK